MKPCLSFVVIIIHFLNNVWRRRRRRRQQFCQKSCHESSTLNPQKKYKHLNTVLFVSCSLFVIEFETDTNRNLSNLITKFASWTSILFYCTCISRLLLKQRVQDSRNKTYFGVCRKTRSQFCAIHGIFTSHERLWSSWRIPLNGRNCSSLPDKIKTWTQWTGCLHRKTKQ